MTASFAKTGVVKCMRRECIICNYSMSTYLYIIPTILVTRRLCELV